MAIMIVEPAKPPAAAVPVKALSRIRETAAGTASRFMMMSPRQMTIYSTAMNGMTLEDTLAMLCRPPSVMAAMRIVRMMSVAIFEMPKESSTLSTMALTCGKVPMPR